MRLAEMLDDVPEADDVKGAASEVLLQEIPFHDVEAESLPGERDAFARDVDPRDAVEPLPDDIEKEAVSGPDLEQAAMPGRIEKLLQDLQPKTEVLREDRPVGEVIAVFRAAEVVVAVKVEELLVRELGVREDQAAPAASQDPRAVRVELVGIAKDAPRIHSDR
jgi:hypothetical protein